MAEHLLTCDACDNRATVVVLSESGSWFARCGDHPLITSKTDRIVGVTVVVQGG